MTAARPDAAAVNDTFDSWQRCGARLSELQQSFLADRNVDPRVDALVEEVKILRACTAELFVVASASDSRKIVTPSVQTASR